LLRLSKSRNESKQDTGKQRVNGIQDSMHEVPLGSAVVGN